MSGQHMSIIKPKISHCINNANKKQDVISQDMLNMYKDWAQQTLICILFKNEIMLTIMKTREITMQLKVVVPKVWFRISKQNKNKLPN